MSFAFSSPRARRRPSLTPMIDVVFLLLVFFMLAARFGQDGAIDLSIAPGSATEWAGPPRLIDIAADAVRLNGMDTPLQGLEQALTELTGTKSDPIVLRPQDGTDLQRLLDVMAILNAAGFTALILVSP